MPRSAFFRNFGFFVLDDFLGQELCAQFCTEMCRAAPKQGKIVLSSGEELIDENIRRVMRAKVSGPKDRLIADRLEAIRPRFEEHFGLSLAGSESPEFLLYNQGGFYTPHTDATHDSHARIHRRRISVVIFLNRESEQPADGCYGGGKLTFYRILKEPHWSNCAFSLDSHPGLLVAFRSDVLHEVKPVTFGQRFTIVSWFLAGVTDNLREDHSHHRESTPAYG